VGCSGQGRSRTLPKAWVRRLVKRWAPANAPSIPMSAIWRTERGVRPSPQVLTRGNTFFSTRATSHPASASQ
jgi:hypothetical protein